MKKGYMAKKSIINFSRQLRKDQTKAEALLWERLRNRKLKGYKFRRQHPINNSYVVDFYCASRNLIIEVDGSIHDIEEIKEKDKIREEFLTKWNYRIVRIKNNEIYVDIESVLERILIELEK